MTIREQLLGQLMEQMDSGIEPEDEQILEAIDELILSHPESRKLSLREKATLRKELFYSMRRMDVLQELLENPEITEIMVNGYQVIFVEKKGKLVRYPGTFLSESKLEDVVQKIVGRCNRIVNEQHPIVDARLENGDRVNVVWKPVALDGPILTIRRFSQTPITMEQLIAWGSVTREAAELLELLVKGKYSMMIGGATGSGKTTFLNALSGFIPKEERIITIEDNAELQIQGVENLVRLEAKPAVVEGGSAVTIRELIRSALRMRPNRIIIGEVRGEETFELLSAINTGHAGSLSTAHANSNADMIQRLESMVLMGMQLPLSAIRRQIASGFEIMIFIGRRRDGSRGVEEIAEVLGIREEQVVLKPLFQYREGEGLIRTGNLEQKAKLVKAGLISREEISKQI